MRVLWTEQAFLRLGEIEDFLAAYDPQRAARLVARLIERAATLSRFPRLGRLLPEIPSEELRELIEGRYRIVYRRRRGRIEVLTVFDGRRLLPAEDLAAIEEET